jgi:hypothetical protein
MYALTNTLSQTESHKVYVSSGVGHLRDGRLTPRTRVSLPRADLLLSGLARQTAHGLA